MKPSFNRKPNAAHREYIPHERATEVGLDPTRPELASENARYFEYRTWALENRRDRFAFGTLAFVSVMAFVVRLLFSFEWVRANTWIIYALIFSGLALAAHEYCTTKNMPRTCFYLVLGPFVAALLTVVSPLATYPLFIVPLLLALWLADQILVHNGFLMTRQAGVPGDIRKAWDSIWKPNEILARFFSSKHEEEQGSHSDRYLVTFCCRS